MTTHMKAQKNHCKAQIKKIAKITKLSKSAKSALEVLFHNQRQVKIFILEALEARKQMQTQNDARLALDKSIAKLEREMKQIERQVASYRRAA